MLSLCVFLLIAVLSIFALLSGAVMKAFGFEYCYQAILRKFLIIRSDNSQLIVLILRVIKISI